MGCGGGGGTWMGGARPYLLNLNINYWLYTVKLLLITVNYWLYTVYIHFLNYLFHFQRNESMKTNWNHRSGGNTVKVRIYH